MMPVDTYGRLASGAAPEQQGQALLESLIALLALAVLWGGLHWLAHYQDAALSATHASRHAAFIATRLPAQAISQEMKSPFFSGSAYRWTNLRGQAVLDADTSVHLSWQRVQPLSVQAQPGRGLSHAAVLRRDWGLEDDGILQMRVKLKDDRNAAPESGHRPGFLNLSVFDSPYPSLERSTGILTGAGHALSDTDSQNRAAASGLAWSAAYSVSRLAGADVAQRAAGTDAAWGRPSVSFDWWQPWAGRVPGGLLVDYDTELKGGN